MITQLINYVIFILGTALASYVLVRASGYRPSRYFAVFAGFLLALRVTISISEQFDAATPLSLLLVTVSFAGMITSLMVLLASLFMPQWWEDSRPIRWIVLLYLIVPGLMIVDQLLGLGIIQNEAAANDVSRSEVLTPAGSALVYGSLLFGSGFIVIFLIRAAMVDQYARRTIIIMLGLTIISASLGSIAAQFPAFFGVFNQFQSILLLAIFAYVVLRTHLFEPRSVGIRSAMDAMQDAVLISEPGGKIVFVNGSAQALGAAEGMSLTHVLEQRGFDHAVANQILDNIMAVDQSRLHFEAAAAQAVFAVTAQPLLNAHGAVQGMLVLLSDRTELSQRTRELTTEQQRLSEMVTQLQHEQSQRSELAATVRALSLPLIPVLDGVLVLPLIGTFDQQRMQEFKQVLLQGIDHANARHVLIDLTGVDLVDERHIMGIMEGVQAARLLGAECTLVGIRPEIAQSLVAQSINVQTLRSAATLREALSSYMS